MKAINIKVDQLINPLGLQNKKPRITWNCDSGIRQSAYSYRININNIEKYRSEKV